MSLSIYGDLREAILAGQYRPGDQLVETALASQFGISRTPVREALRRLEQDGLIERGTRGMQVSRRSPEQILEIYEVRVVLETAAARTAAQRRTDLDLVRLEQLHEAMRSASVDDEKLVANTNRRFHEIVWAMSHNKTLVDMLVRLNTHLIRFPETTLTRGDRWEKVLVEHEQLIAAIKAGDVDEAGRIAEEHMIGARNVRLQMYADQDAQGF